MNCHRGAAAFLSWHVTRLSAVVKQEMKQKSETI